MSEERYTVFQRLQKVLSNNTLNNGFVTNKQAPNDVIDTAKSKAEYDKKLLQAKQQKLLGKQWVKANLDVGTQAIAGLNDLRLSYRDADLMNAFPEISAALDITMEEVCCLSQTGSLVNVTSKSERVKNVLQDLFINRLSIHTTLPLITRAMCMYGNNFMLLNIDSKNGVMGWKMMPVYEMERWENGQNTPYASPLTNLNTIDDKKELDTKFVWVGQNEYIPYRNWQMAHFRLLYDSKFLPYGVSMLEKARRHFRMLSMMEDLMLIYRLDRSIERRVFKINVGAIDEADVPAYVQTIANNFKRSPVIDQQTGQVDLRKSFMNVTEDYFIPTRDDNASSPIETLQGAQNLTAMDDIKFIQNKILSALRIPRAFLNFGEEAVGEGQNLSLQDVRFTRTVNRIQQCLLLELNKIAIIHLYLNGFQDDLTNFTLSMNNPSSAAEMLELENLSKKVTTAKDIVSDPGGGIPIASLNWAWKHIFKWSDKEIKRNLDEMRLETALGVELQKTNQIIFRTGVFDEVDNLYGESGAQYDTQGGGEEEGGAGDDGGGSFGGGGGGSFGGGGGFDFGDSGGGDFDDMGDEMGSEGDMDINTAASEEGSSEPPMDAGGAAPEPNISDSLMRSVERKVLTEKKNKQRELQKKSKKYHYLYKNKVANHLIKETNIESADIYDKAFFINEEMNDLKNQLNEISKDKGENK